MKRVYKFSVTFIGNALKTLAFECDVLPPDHELSELCNGRMVITNDGSLRIWDHGFRILEADSSSDWDKFFRFEGAGPMRQVKSIQEYDLNFEREYVNE
jgi:hypothetical protein